MSNSDFANSIKVYVDAEIKKAADSIKDNNFVSAFQYLERAHVLGQAVTVEHTRVHWLMLKIGWKNRDWREIFGQMFRIVGASTKTPLGIYPTGNTGGANVSPFKPLPIPDDLQKIIEKAKGEKI
jgi:hypothetical protein